MVSKAFNTVGGTLNEAVSHKQGLANNEFIQTTYRIEV